MSKPYIYIAVICTGIVISFVNIDNPLFWEDEVSTIIHTSGETLDEFPLDIPVNQIKNRSFYTDLISLNNGDYSFVNQVKGLSKMPQFTPGHYYFLTLWHRVFGDYFLTYRYFSFLIFLLTLPLIFLLSKELTHSTVAAWVSTSLFSVTPFFVAYALEARYYILWIFIVALLHLIFTKGIKKNNLLLWTLYALAAIIAMYISLFSAMAIFSHAFYIAFFRKDLWLRFGLAQCCILLGYLPWMLLLWQNHDLLATAMEWQKSAEWNMDISAYQIILGQYLGWAEIFSDGSNSLLGAIFSKEFTPAFYIHFSIAALGATLILLAFIIAVKVLKKRNYGWLLGLMIIPNFFFFIILDLYRDSFTSLVYRYQAISFIAVILATGFIIGWLIEKRGYFSIIYFMLIVFCLFSLNNIFSNACYNKRFDCGGHIQSAEALSSSGKVLLITDFNPTVMNFYPLLFTTENENIDIIYSKKPYPDFKGQFELTAYDKVFITHASPDLDSAIRQNIKADDKINIGVIAPGY